MPNIDSNPRDIKLSIPGNRLYTKPAVLPRALSAGVRAAGAPKDPFVNPEVVVTEAEFDLTLAARGSATVEVEENLESNRVLALETEDGTTIFIRADRLQEELGRLYPDEKEKGILDIGALRDPEASSRGVSDWIWSRLSVLDLQPDAIIDTARRKAAEWAMELLGEQAKEKLLEIADFGASRLGAKALMWAIESRLADRPGLYRWRGPEFAPRDYMREEDPHLEAACREGPILVFIHGTGSNTWGSFGDLNTVNAKDWEKLSNGFGKRVYGFEHRTFSESPITNALALARVLPAGARFSVVTHSRGGLVGDLLCLSGLDEVLIQSYRRTPPANGEASDEAEIRELVTLKEQAQLRELRDLLSERNFRIDRYVRVACPARGTTLLSDNLELFLSSLLSLAGMVSGLATHPVYSALKRVVLEIAHHRVDPHLVPGIEAMMTDAPMAQLLSRVERKQGIEMAVIAGDIEGGGMLQRIGVMFTDWMFFNRIDNDLVVDTESMYAGLARAAKSRYLFIRHENASHFHYFDNALSRGALRDWLSEEHPDKLPDFSSLAGRGDLAAREGEVRMARRARGERPFNRNRPVVIVLPGITGSHLEKRKPNQRPGEGDRIWFDFLELALGGLAKISYRRKSIEAEDLFDMFYGKICTYLESTHEVVRFPYDWRRPAQEEADRLAEKIEEIFEKTEQPVRLLAHSMGGLVARCMMARHETLWGRVAERPGARFVMLGTPNNGSHSMVESLLGKSDTIRRLARLDLKNGLQEILDIVGEYRGGLQLLPRPGFGDRCGERMGDYFNRKVWEHFREVNRDRWFGDRVSALPPAAALTEAETIWAKTLRENELPQPGMAVYVHGVWQRTPCGIRKESGRLKMIGTLEGDGTVTWESGKLDNLPEAQRWYMPARHGDMVDTSEHFPAILDLLQDGVTRRLSQTAPRLRAEARPIIYDAGPAPIPSEEELVRGLLGGTVQRETRRKDLRTLEVAVKAMDLRFAPHTVMCGHYVGDPISGAEAQIDRYLVAKTLTRRLQLGLYAGEIGTSTVALQPRNDEERRRGDGKGALIVGLGEYGQLTVRGIAEAVRAGTLNFLMRWQERECEQGMQPDEKRGLTLQTLLIGYNSTTNVSIEDSVDAIVLGVCDANQQFSRTCEGTLHIGRLEFIERYLDNAISAAYAVRLLNERLRDRIESSGTRLTPESGLIENKGVCARLRAGGGAGYWPRLMVTDADRGGEHCPPECYESHRVSPIPREVIDELLAQSGKTVGEKKPVASRKKWEPPLARRLKYLYMSQRARAESVMQQSQPGLVETLVARSITNRGYNKDLARTLFELLLPLDFKMAIRQTEQLLLVLDGYTANLPWEMLRADEEPLVLQTRVVRQLASTRYRSEVRVAMEKRAYVVGNPSTKGYAQAFHPNAPDAKDPVSLVGAEDEANTVTDELKRAAYDVVRAREGSSAEDVINKLFQHPYRIIHIAAHGVFRAIARDGTPRSGVILSDGMLLTANEVGRMEIVPELVFLNCCHLGKADAFPTDANRLAYSLARELIEIGVRCVVVAGWAVDDAAASTFAEQFYNRLLNDKRKFGDAVYMARKTVYESHPGTNTWGAYQAYGDPAYVMDPGSKAKSNGSEWRPVAPQELIERIRRESVDATHDRGSAVLEAHVENVEEMLGAVPENWRDLPWIQYELGQFFSNLGPEYFDRAAAAYERAISGLDMRGHVPVKAIEQLANLEARAGEISGEEVVINRAIRRMKALLEITEETKGGARSPGEANLERWSILGGAYLRKAALRAKKGGAKWGTGIRPVIEDARDAYARAEEDPSRPDYDPYPRLNRLQLDALLDLEGNSDVEKLKRAGISEKEARLEIGKELIESAGHCRERAREAFARSNDFFDALKPADALLAERMLENTVGEEGKRKAIIELFRHAMEKIPGTSKELDSVVGHLKMLAELSRAAGRKLEAEGLKQIVAEIERSRAGGGASHAQPG